MTPAERDARRYLRDLQLAEARSCPAAEVADFATLDPVAAFVLSRPDLDQMVWDDAREKADEEIGRQRGGLRA
jgi:hypothetical protein